MPDNTPDRVEAQLSLSKAFMAVLMCTADIFGIIDMENCDLIFSDDTVKFINHPIKVVYHILARIVGMAGVKADAQLVVIFHAVVNGSQLFKAASDLRAFACHRFQCDDAVQIRRQHFV